jgi:hypothetical protein
LRKLSVLSGGVVLVVLGAAAFFGRGFFRGAMTIHDLLTENQPAQGSHHQPDH